MLDKPVGSVGHDGIISDAEGRPAGRVDPLTGTVYRGDRPAGYVTRQGDIYDEAGKVGEIARSGNIWSEDGTHIGWLPPLNYWKSAIARYYSFDAPILLAGGAALLLVLKHSPAPGPSSWGKRAFRTPLMASRLLE